MPKKRKPQSPEELYTEKEGIEFSDILLPPIHPSVCQSEYALECR